MGPQSMALWLLLALGTLDSAFARGCDVDAMFIIDSSSSVREDFRAQTRLAAELSELFVIGPGAHRAAVLEYSGPSKIVKTFGFEEIQSSAHLKLVLEELTHFSGVTFTQRALQHAHEHILEHRRPGIDTVVILISDGFATDRPELIAPQMLATADVVVFAVSVSEPTDEKALALLTGDERRVFVNPNAGEKAKEALSRWVACDRTFPAPASPLIGAFLPPSLNTRTTAATTQSPFIGALTLDPPSPFGPRSEDLRLTTEPGLIGSFVPPDHGGPPSPSSPDSVVDSERPPPLPVKLSKPHPHPEPSNPSPPEKATPNLSFGKGRTPNGGPDKRNPLPRRPNGRPTHRQRPKTPSSSVFPRPKDDEEEVDVPGNPDSSHLRKPPRSQRTTRAPHGRGRITPEQPRGRIVPSSPPRRGPRITPHRGRNSSRPRGTPSSRSSATTPVPKRNQGRGLPDGGGRTRKRGGPEGSRPRVPSDGDPSKRKGTRRRGEPPKPPKGKPWEKPNGSGPGCEVDVVLLLDTSSASPLLFHSAVDAASALVSRLIVGGPLEARVAILDMARPDAPLHSFAQLRNQPQILKALKSLRHEPSKGGKVCIPSGLAGAGELLAKEGRHGAAKTVVLFTSDAGTACPDRAGEGRKLRRAGVHLSAVRLSNALGEEGVPLPRLPQYSISNKDIASSVCDVEPFVRGFTGRHCPGTSRFEFLRRLT